MLLADANGEPIPVTGGAFASVLVVPEPAVPLLLLGALAAGRRHRPAPGRRLSPG